MHTSLDGFVAGLNGGMDWIMVDEKLFDRVAELTDRADTAMYGRVTYQMMESYWPGAGDKPEASKHDIEHSGWYNRVNKVVISTTLKGVDKNKTTIIGGNIVEDVKQLKNQMGKDILIFGSPTASYSLMRHNLIDEYCLFVNPILLGQGIRLFNYIIDRIKLKLVDSTLFETGVVELHYVKIN